VTEGGRRPAETYTHGHHASVVGQHQRRTAEEAAAFLLPRLNTGDRVLDFGCGPGTITTGLARAVAPGSVVGLDIVHAVLALARDHVAEQQSVNTLLTQGSVYELPFADATFAAAYAHQVLQHLADPVLALREARRVVRPGGLVAVRDADYATMVWWPREPRMERWLELYHAVATRNGGEADAGRRIPSWLREAGFEEVETTTETWHFDDRDSILQWGDSWAERLTRSALAQQAVDYGLATVEELAEIAVGWRDWARQPDAFFTFIHVAGLARRV
jgi:ubiquinone/menaquinone biosynthesis C-methylase UbiE